jgi:protein-disulfide isomerase-like protein with CxxC motif
MLIAVDCFGYGVDVRSRLQTLTTIRRAAYVRGCRAERVGALAAVEVAGDVRGLQQTHFGEIAHDEASQR